MKHNLHAIREGTMKVVFLLTACISILAVALICIFLFANGIPTMHKIGLGKFLFGMVWAPNQDLYGIFPMIIASILVTGGAILIGVPLGLLCALYLARFCPKRLYSVLKPAVDLLAGIPSIVYGFFGLVVLVPALLQAAVDEDLPAVDFQTVAAPRDSVGRAEETQLHTSVLLFICRFFSFIVHLFCRKFQYNLSPPSNQAEMGQRLDHAVLVCCSGDPVHLPLHLLVGAPHGHPDARVEQHGQVVFPVSESHSVLHRDAEVVQALAHFGLI